MAGSFVGGYALKKAPQAEKTSFWVETEINIPKVKKVHVAIGKYDSYETAERARSLPCLALEYLDFGFPGSGKTAKILCQKFKVKKHAQIVEKIDVSRASR